MNSFSVGWACQECTTRGEWEREDGCSSFQSSSQLIQLGSIPCIKNPDHSSFETGCRNPCICPGELKCCKLTLMCWNHNSAGQSLSIKNLQNNTIVSILIFHWYFSISHNRKILQYTYTYPKWIILSYLLVFNILMSRSSD